MTSSKTKALRLERLINSTKYDKKFVGFQITETSDQLTIDFFGTCRSFNEVKRLFPATSSAEDILQLVIFWLDDRLKEIERAKITQKECSN
jgi:hypothetical protein